MSIQSEIERITNNVNSTLTIISETGVETGTGSDALPAAAEALANTKANKENSVFYIEGTGTTAGTWLGSHDDITEYYDGLMIAYKVGIAGKSGGTTLNINGLGAVNVVRNVTTAVTTHYGVNSILFLTYTVDSSGTAYWKTSDYDSDTKTRSSNKTGTKMYIIGAAAQSTSGQTTYSNANCYIGTDNCLYSGGEKVAVAADLTHDHDEEYLGLSGGTLTGSVTFNSSTTSQASEPSINWPTYGANSNTPFIGFATDQTDGTFVVCSLRGKAYATGLAIGGGSGNLLWKGSPVAVTASPAFTGTPTAPTAAAGTNTTQIATTAFVTAAISAAIGDAIAASY